MRRSQKRMIEQLHDIEFKLDFLDSERIAHLTSSLRDKATVNVASCQTESSPKNNDNTEINNLQEMVRELEQAKTNQNVKNLTQPGEILRITKIRR